MDRRLTMFALLVSGTIACADATLPDDGAPPDAEHGLIDWGRADDNSVVRPGTPEAEAVLAYVNQTIANDAAGQAFLAELDTQLHRLSAENIVAARAGADGTFGTADDATFGSLEELDAVRWVGRAALQQLFVLADAAGYFVGSVLCDTVAGNHITSMAQLIEIENSRCDHFDGNVTIDIDATILPAHRQLKAFDRVRFVRGKLAVTHSRGLDRAVFRSLREVGTLDAAELPVYSERVDFPVLTTVNNLLRNPGIAGYTFDTLEGAGQIQWRDVPATFPNLKRVGSISIVSPTVEGFDALESALFVTLEVQTAVKGFSALDSVRNLLIYSRGAEPSSSPLVVEGFDSLRTARDLRIEVERSSRDTVTLTALPALEWVETLRLTGNSIVFPALTMADLIDIDGWFAGEFTELREVRRLDVKTVGYTFPELHTITEFGLIRGIGPQRPSKLATVGGSLQFDAAVSPFNQLRSIGGSLYVLCEDTVWDGLNALESVEQLSIDATDCEFEGLRSLETLPGPLTLRSDGLNSTLFDPLPNLVRSGDLVYADSDGPTRPALLASLELVDGFMRIHRHRRQSTNQVVGMPLEGFDALETINGDVLFYQASEIRGLSAVRTIGGERIGFPRTMRAAERDLFLNQLQQFSGDIISL